MGHGIAAGDTMFSVREVPWHGLGSVLEGAPTSAEGIVLAGQDWTVEQVPMLAQYEGGATVAVEGYRALMRSDTGATLGVRTDKYEAIQNTTIWERIVEPFRAQGAVPITGGALWGGRECWVLLEGQDGIAIPGDDSLTKGYLLLTWAHDGSQKFEMRDTWVRVVCANTQRAARASSGTLLTVKHTKGAVARTERIGERVAELGASLAAWSEQAAALAAAPFDNDAWHLLAGAIAPLDTDAEGKVLDNLRTARAFETQDALLALRGGATVAGSLADNALGAYYAATELYDHLLGVSVNPDKRNLAPEAGWRRTLGGERDDEKRTALVLVGGIAGVSVA